MPHVVVSVDYALCEFIPKRNDSCLLFKAHDPAAATLLLDRTSKQTNEDAS